MSFAEELVGQRVRDIQGGDNSTPRAQIFKSFWMGGFESACQINTVQRRIDMIASTQHDRFVREDYRLLKSVGMSVARDAIRWPLIEKQPGIYDFSSFAPMLSAAEEEGVQVIWTLLHYGWPEDLDFFSDAFVERFRRFCRAVAEFVHAQRSPHAPPPIYTPINEMSFLSWAIGKKGIIYPYAIGRDWEVKCQLVRAAIAAMDEIWAVDRRARFAHVDPVIHVVAPRGRPELEDAARAQHHAQYQVWDMLCGKLEPDLGGHHKYLDLIGINYYHSNQFECPDIRLRWEDRPRDDRFVPFHKLLGDVVERYHRPVFIAETSHFGEGRALWLHEMAEEICTARLKGLPLEGVCLYPFLDRPDWENEEHWHHSGLVDLERDAQGNLHRALNQEYWAALRDAQRLVGSLQSQNWKLELGTGKS